jgi:cardiolipin synthase
MEKKISMKGVMIVAAGVFVCSVLIFYSDFTKQIGKPIRTEYAISDPAFLQTLSGLLGQEFVDGNKITPLENGGAIFPAMLEAIRSAEKSITFETYIWESDRIGMAFQKALIERARKGVAVLVIVDGMGTLKLKNEDIDELKGAGVQFVKYGRDRWYKIKANLNHRTHRKLLIVDGKVGFTGGVCIAEKWDGNAENLEKWRDNHYRIEGPAVKQLQGIFAENWLQTTGEVIHGEKFFAEVESAGSIKAQPFMCGPRENQETARLVHLYAIASARKSIRLSHAYFVPDKLCIEALVAAAKRGVKIQVIVPGKNDSALGRCASRDTWKKPILAGVEIYQYQQALLHSKFMIVDDCFVTFGSINFDNRSFRLNDEANVNVLDKDFAEQNIRIFERDLAVSRRLTKEEYLGRPWYTKAVDQTASLFQSQL